MAGFVDRLPFNNTPPFVDLGKGWIETRKGPFLRLFVINCISTSVCLFFCCENIYTVIHC